MQSNPMYQPNTGFFTPDLEVNYARISSLVRDYPSLKEFAEECHLPDFAVVAQDPAELLMQLTPLHLSAKLHLLEMGELHGTWGRDAGCHCSTVPGKLVGEWHVMLELMGPKKQLVTGWVLTACGHFVEDIASGQGYLKGPLALRGTSFDSAVELLGRTTNFPTDHEVLRKTADSFVGLLNGAWVGMACALHERHSCIDLLMHCITGHASGNTLLATVVERHAKALAQALSVPNFYHQFVDTGEKWESEKHMCMAMDEATKQLLQDLR